TSSPSSRIDASPLSQNLSHHHHQPVAGGGGSRPDLAGWLGDLAGRPGLRGGGRTGGRPPAARRCSRPATAAGPPAAPPPRVAPDLALYGKNRELIASVGVSLRLPPPRHRGGWFISAGGPAWSFRLPDGRILVARLPLHHRHPALNLVIFLGAIALLVAACA